MRSRLDLLIEHWKSGSEDGPEVMYSLEVPATQGAEQVFPKEVAHNVAQALRTNGIQMLYRHQAEAFFHCLAGENVLVTTGTASGKSLCYQLPIIKSLAEDPEACALCLFPTKALANDQLASFNGFINSLPIPPGMTGDTIIHTYDGDSGSSSRQAARRSARLLLSNPDMLHVGILPHHPTWARLLANLKYIVLDEVHLYRGVWGSHVANVLRRMKRVLNFYGAAPTYIVTSATIGNAVEFASRLTGESFQLVHVDGAPHPKKYLVTLNPPLLNRDLNIRQSVAQTFLPLAGDLIRDNIQTLFFTITRKSAETLGKLLRERYPHESHRIVTYRSGYLPGQRRKLEKEIKESRALITVSTNALEVGVDIGQLDCVVIGGFPGTISSFKQQGGRAGRKEQDAAVIFLPNMSPLDQYLASHPEELYEKPNEMAVINPNNPLILHQHLQCSLFELPFQVAESYGDLPGELLQAYLKVMQLQEKAHQRGDAVYWLADAYPAAGVSIRSAEGQPFRLLVGEEGARTVIGEVDASSARWYVHPGAVYLHQGTTYLVDQLDLEKNEVTLHQEDTDYYTVPINESEILPGEQRNGVEKRAFIKQFGDLTVTTQVIGYKRVLWSDPQSFALVDQALPPTQLFTYGSWLLLSPEIVAALTRQGLWSGSANSYGPNWEGQKQQARARDGFRCANCGAQEKGIAHAVHHRIPFRQFPSYILANELSNLVTLCPVCHRLAEAQVKTRTGLAGLTHLLSNLASLHLMCDIHDLGWWTDGNAPQFGSAAAVLAFDTVPGGIGLSQQLFDSWDLLLKKALDLTNSCPCYNGCPSCVGPAGPEGLGCKSEVLALLGMMV